MAVKETKARVALRSHRSWADEGNKHTELILIEEDSKLVSKRKASEKDRRVVGEFSLLFEAQTGETKQPKVTLKGTAKMRQTVTYSSNNDKAGKRQFVLVLTYDREHEEAKLCESCLGRGASFIFMEVAQTKDMLEEKEAASE